MQQPSPVGHSLQQHMPIGDKLPTSSSSLHFPPGIFGPPRPLKTLTLPPPPVPSPTSHTDALPPSMFHPPTLPPPPGLLHILMSAEKCQVSLNTFHTFLSNGIIPKELSIWGLKLAQMESLSASKTNSGIDISPAITQSPPPIMPVPLIPSWEMLQVFFKVTCWSRVCDPLKGGVTCWHSP